MSQEWKLVPVEPTEEMIAAGRNLHTFESAHVYRAMLKAAPLPPAGGEVDHLQSEWMDDGDDGWGHRLTVEVYRAESVKQIVTRLQAEVRDLDRWRDLALQFDNHRMAALWHLKAFLQSNEHETAAHDFLCSPPLAAHEVVAERDALKADKKRAESMLKASVAAEDFDALQSELTKVKEDLRLEKLTCRAMSIQANDWAKLAAERKSELTKARELLKHCNKYLREDGHPTLAHMVNAFLAHQSAPAAKDGE